MLSAETERILATPYASLDELLQNAPPEDAHQIVDELDALLMRAAVVSKYMEVRLGLTGSGTHPHNDAMKAAIKRYRAIRKSLGYSYPNAGLSSF